MLNINDIGLITAEDVVGQYHAFGPSVSAYKDAACDGSCTTTCSAQSDGVDCNGNCAGNCSVSCNNSCDGSCNTNVDDKTDGGIKSCTVCSGSCLGSCSGDCTGGCGDANCEGECSLSCQSMCSVGCENFCEGTCLGYCFETCVNGCKDVCTGGCSNSCSGCSGCSGGCISACVDGCKYSCMNVSTADGTGAISPNMPNGGIYSVETIVQTDTMPEPTEALNNQIYQYIGDSVSQYTNGNFYKCVNVNTDSGTEYIWRNITNPDFYRMLTDIVAWLNTISQYKYTRISELPESVLVQDGDTFAANLQYSDEELEDMHLVISNVDNRTVRVSAASLMKYMMHNYQNNWAWTPVIKEDPETHVMTVIDWEYGFWDKAPQPINLGDLVTGGVGRVTDDGDGLMPHEMYTELKNKEVMDISFITGKNRNGETAVGVPLLRFNSQEAGAFNINSAFVEDVMQTFAQSGDYLTKDVADTLYATIKSEQDLFTLLRYVMGPDALDPTSPADFPENLITVNIPALYLTKADAAVTYAPIGISSTVTSLQTSVSNLQTTVNNFPNTYLTRSVADDTYVSKANATTEIPARVGASTDPSAPDPSNGLMTPADVANIANALNSINDINDDIIEIQEAIAGLDPAGFATDTTAGIVKVPTTSSITVGLDGAIDTKKYTVNNLIKNSLFSEGFDNTWDPTGIDTSLSVVRRDTTTDRDIATITFNPDGVYTQEFYSDTRDGFTVGILFKQGEFDKTIEVKIDSSAYMSHTIEAGTGYYVAEFYFADTDTSIIDTHTLTIHNPDTVNAVAFDMSEVMVQNGKKFTGWNRNPYDISGVNSINIVSYDNYIAFKDKVNLYTEDVYDEDGVTIIHHAGDIIDPSSSIILHKNQQYMFMHITAVREIDGQIRQDVIPLRVDLLTGKCDISGNAVTAGTLIDNTGELVPTVAEINAFIGGQAISLDDVYNEVEASVMPTASADYVGKLYYYTGETDANYTHNVTYQCVETAGVYSWQQLTSYVRKYKFALNKTIDDVVSEITNVLHVGKFYNSTSNGEIFNDYVNNVADTAFAHVEGTGNTANQGATYSHVEGIGNTATGGATAAHVEGSGNIITDGATFSHVEGSGNEDKQNAPYNHIEGAANVSVQAYTHIEGQNNLATYYTDDTNGQAMPNGNNLFRSVIVDTLPDISQSYNDEMYLVYDSATKNYKKWYAQWTDGVGTWVEYGTVPITSGGSTEHIEGRNNIAGSTNVHVEGSKNIVKTSSEDTHVEGKNNIVYEGSSQTHVEGKDNTIYNGVNYSHIEGYNNRSGYTNNGSGLTAMHIEGQYNIASSGMSNSHIEGYNNALQLSGTNTVHIEGYMNRPAQNNYGGHIEGYKNTTTGTLYASHIGGLLNTVNGGHVGLHVEGLHHTIPYGKSQLDPSTDTVSGGSDIGGHIEGNYNSLELNPNVSTMQVGGAYHIEGDGNKITYMDHERNITNSGSYLADDNHLEGGGNTISGGTRNHIEGNGNYMYGDALHTEGYGNKAYNVHQGHVEGGSNTVKPASGTTYSLYAVHVEGQSHNLYGITNGSHVEGQSNTVYSNNSTYQLHMEGGSNTIGTNAKNVSTSYAHIEGNSHSIDATMDTAFAVHVEGNYNKITNIDSIGGGSNISIAHVEGTSNQVDANYSHTEGSNNKMYYHAQYSHGEGYSNNIYGPYSHVEGQNNTVYGQANHVEGYYNTTGEYDSVGKIITNYSTYAHVEGDNNTALNSIEHVEGSHNTARSVYSHIEGTYNENTVYSQSSHTAGDHNINATPYSTVVGLYNKPDNTYGDNVYSSSITLTTSSEISVASGTAGSVVTTSTSTDAVTDFIEVDGDIYGVYVVAAKNSNNRRVVAAYDEDKIFISYIFHSTDDSNEFIFNNLLTPENRISGIKYIRVSATIDNNTEIRLMQIPNLFVVGNGKQEQTGAKRSNILEVGINHVNINGDLYQNGELFISGTPHFVGTSVEWEALSAEEKAEYEGGDIVFTDDNEGTGVVDDVVTEDSPNPISSRGVYNALATITRPDPTYSTNRYYFARTYYDGRILIHYRRHFDSVTLSNSTATAINLGNWDGLDSKYDTIISNAFNDNNNITSMLVLKSSSANQICQINCLGRSLDDYVAWIACTGNVSYTGELTIDFVIDTF